MFGFSPQCPECNNLSSHAYCARLGTIGILAFSKLTFRSTPQPEHLVSHSDLHKLPSSHCQRAISSASNSPEHPPWVRCKPVSQTLRWMWHSGCPGAHLTGYLSFNTRFPQILPYDLLNKYFHARLLSQLFLGNLCFTESQIQRKIPNTDKLGKWEKV